jgi:hypothetical protein
MVVYLAPTPHFIQPGVAIGTPEIDFHLHPTSVFSD